MAEADDFVPPLPMEEEPTSARDSPPSPPTSAAANGAGDHTANNNATEEGSVAAAGPDGTITLAAGEAEDSLAADGQASTSQPAAGPTREEEEQLLKARCLFKVHKAADVLVRTSSQAPRGYLYKV